MAHTSLLSLTLCEASTGRSMRRLDNSKFSAPRSASSNNTLARLLRGYVNKYHKCKLNKNYSNMYALHTITVKCETFMRHTMTHIRYIRDGLCEEYVKHMKHACQVA